MKRTLIVLTILASGLSALALPMNLYNDTITQGSGIMATPNWDNEGTWLHWDIEQNGDLWHYEYCWHTDGADLSHITIELTEGATADDFSNWTYGPGAAGVEVGDPTFGWFSPSTGNSNPGMPGSLYGFTLNPDPSVPVFCFSFDTWRSPVWGDFYGKDGRHDGQGSQAGFTYAYNTGYLLADENDGMHIARPNGERVADGGLTIAMLGLALLALEALRNRLGMAHG